MKAITIGKTILIWDKLTNEQITELKQSLIQILKWYDNICKNYKMDIPIPIKLKQKNQYLSIVTKNNYTLLSTNMVKQSSARIYNYSPIVNGDILYDSIYILKNCKEDLEQYVKTSLKYPKIEWMKLPYIEAYENYLLSPNINPDNFIKSLQKGTLPETYRKFLSDVGIALDKMQPEQQITIENIDIDYEE